MTVFTSGQSEAGEPRRAAVSSIQIMSPWAPLASQASSRSAVFGAASARAKPTAEKPSSRAFRFRHFAKLCLAFQLFLRITPFYFAQGVGKPE